MNIFDALILKQVFCKTILFWKTGVVFFSWKVLVLKSQKSQNFHSKTYLAIYYYLFWESWFNGLFLAWLHHSVFKSCVFSVAKSVSFVMKNSWYGQKWIKQTTHDFQKGVIGSNLCKWLQKGVIGGNLCKWLSKRCYWRKRYY